MDEQKNERNLKKVPGKKSIIYGVIQERENRGVIKWNNYWMVSSQEDYSLKKTQSDILQMNVASSVLTDNKELDSGFKKLILLVKTIIC